MRTHPHRIAITSLALLTGTASGMLQEASQDRACSYDLRVVDEGGRPRPRVAVRVVDLDRVEELGSFPTSGPDSLEAWLLDREPTTFSDAAGWVQVTGSTPAGPGSLVIASLGTRRAATFLGLASIPPDSLVLSSPPSFPVQVVDPTGQGVPGVRIAIDAWQEDLRFGTQTVGTTDAAGRLMVRHFTPHWSQVAPSEWSLVLPGFIAAERVRARYSPDAPPSQGIRMQVPHTGTLTLRFLDAAGSPRPTAGSVFVSVLDGDGDFFELSGAELRVPHVQLGQRLEVTLFPPEGGRVMRSMHGPSANEPSATGEFLVPRDVAVPK